MLRWLPTSKTQGDWRRYKSDTFQACYRFDIHPFEVANLSNTRYQKVGCGGLAGKDQRGELFQAVRMEKQMGLMLGLIIGVAAFNIISALIMVAMDSNPKSPS